MNAPVPARRIVLAVIGCVVVGVAAMALYAFTAFDRLEDDFEDLMAEMPKMCGPTLDDCRGLAATKFGERLPRFPPPTTGSYRFASGEESGELLMLRYESADGLEPVFVIFAPRWDDGGLSQPPADWNGRPVEGTNDEGAIRRLDWWDDRFHYAVAFERRHQPRGSPGEQALRDLAASIRG